MNRVITSGDIKGSHWARLQKMCPSGSAALGHSATSHRKQRLITREGAESESFSSDTDGVHWSAHKTVVVSSLDGLNILWSVCIISGRAFLTVGVSFSPWFGLEVLLVVSGKIQSVSLLPTWETLCRIHTRHQWILCTCFTACCFFPLCV